MDIVFSKLAKAPLFNEACRKCIVVTQNTILTPRKAVNCILGVKRVMQYMLVNTVCVT